MHIEITANTAEVIGRLGQFGQRAPGAILSALNRSGAAGRSTAARTIAGDVGLEASVVEKSFYTTRATDTDEAYALTITERVVPAIDFGGEQTGSGVDIRGGRVSIRSAFQARMRSGHVGFFKRTGIFGRRGNPRLERIAEIKLPVTDVMDVALVTGAVTARVHEVFPVAFDGEISSLTETLNLQSAGATA